jgi:hypothetical protein
VPDNDKTRTTNNNSAVKSLPSFPGCTCTCICRNLCLHPRRQLPSAHVPFVSADLSHPSSATWRRAREDRSAIVAHQPLRHRCSLRTRKACLHSASLRGQVAEFESLFPCVVCLKKATVKKTLHLPHHLARRVDPRSSPPLPPHQEPVNTHGSVLVSVSRSAVIVVDFLPTLPLEPCIHHCQSQHIIDQRKRSYLPRLLPTHSRASVATMSYVSHWRYHPSLANSLYFTFYSYIRTPRQPQSYHASLGHY